jgi:hypothetical protein
MLVVKVHKVGVGVELEFDGVACWLVVVFL